MTDAAQPSSPDEPFEAVVAEIAGMSDADVARLILRERGHSREVRSIADERLAALDRMRDKASRFEGELKAAQTEARIYSNDRDNLRRQLDNAQGAAMEMRGRLLESRGAQMVRRGDFDMPDLPKVYAGWEEVPF